LGDKNIMANSRSPRDWNEVIASLEDDLLQKGRSRHSVSAYSSALRKFGRFYREELKKPGPYLARLQENDFHAFVDHLRSTQYLAASSVNLAIAALRALSRYALEQRWHKRDIAKDLRTYYVAPSPAPPRLSSGELRRLITSIDLDARNGLRDFAILQLLLQCGLRLGEISRISVDDVILHQTTGRIRVRDEKTRSDRFVPLNATVRSALEKYLKVRGTAAGGDPLFVSQWGKRISTKTVQYQVKKYLGIAGRPDLSPSGLRHHFALGFYDKIGNLSAVQTVLGHRNIATTARYVKPTEKEIAHAMEELPENVYHSDPKRELSR
jgi:site-specific recombinase XerD